MPQISALLALASVVPGTSSGTINADQASLIGWGIVGVIVVMAMQLLSLVFAGIKATRRTPPLHETYATKMELAILSDRWAKSEARSDASLKEIFTELRTIHRSLGRVEAIEATVKSMHEDTNARLADLSSRLPRSS